MYLLMFVSMQSLQVLSESVSKALTLRGGEAAEGTACFLLLMNKFFDCTNVKNYSAGARSPKPFQLPYLSAEGERLTVLGLTITHGFISKFYIIYRTLAKIRPPFSARSLGLLGDWAFN